MFILFVHSLVARFANVLFGRGQVFLYVHRVCVSSARRLVEGVPICSPCMDILGASSCGASTRVSSLGIRS
jgi:hypothetical protein